LSGRWVSNGTDVWLVGGGWSFIRSVFWDRSDDALDGSKDGWGNFIGVHGSVELSLVSLLGKGESVTVGVTIDSLVFGIDKSHGVSGSWSGSSILVVLSFDSFFIRSSSFGSCLIIVSLDG